jgi:biotin carboxyl carrier protein
MELNEGIRFLTGQAKVSLPLAKKADAEAARGPAPAVAPVAAKARPSPGASAAPAPAPAVLGGPVTTTCTVVEGGTTRRFRITIEPPVPLPTASVGERPALEAPALPAPDRVPIYSPFEGKVEVVEVIPHVGEAVVEGQVVAEVEAMKTKHDVRAPCSGRVASIDAAVGSDVDAGRPILTLAR